MPAEPTQSTAPPHEACTVQERVAIGTAGVVYRGVHTASGRDVTFKVLSKRSSHPLEPERVLALRWRLEALQHPVIASLIDAYEDPEGFVIITTWIDGGIGGNEFPRKRRNLTMQEARLVAMRLCGALLIGEQQRFPHGDLKPSNVILADRGQQGLEIQIQDWGLSVCREEQPAESLQFMAPERHHGHPASVQGDLFSAGATLWYLLTGEAPAYGSSSQEVLQDWGSFDASALALLRPDLDDHFRQWLGWLLRWQPGDRPQSVSQALDVLNDVVAYGAAMEAQSKKQAEAPPVPAPAVTPTPFSPPAATTTAPGPAKPTAPRPGAAKPQLHLPVAPAQPPPSDASKAKSAKDKPPKEKANIGQRVMATVMGLCLVTAIGIAFVAWAQDRYGEDWRKKLWSHWSGVFSSREETTVAEATPAAPAPKAAPTPAPAKTKAPVKTGTTPKSPPLAKATAANSKATAKTNPKSTAPKPFAVDRLDGSGNLQGRTGGTGWKGAWVAQSVSLEKDQALLGKGSASTASRAMGNSKNVPGDYVALSIMVSHPGKDAPPLELDILSPDGEKLVAPATVAFEDGKVRVFIQGAKDKLEAPADKPFRLLVRWDWKTKKGDKRQVTISAMVNPPSEPPASGSIPSSKRTLSEHHLPKDFSLVLQSGSAAEPVKVSELRVGRYYRDAFP